MKKILAVLTLVVCAGCLTQEEIKADRMKTLNYNLSRIECGPGPKNICFCTTIYGTGIGLTIDYSGKLCKDELP